MALRLILGGSGAGKTYELYRCIMEESMKHPEKNFLVIVPEQFTMAAQKDFVMNHPRHGIMNIDILSFHRLACRIFEENASENRQILEDIGKTMLLRKVLENKKKELAYFKGNLTKPGFVDEMKSLLSELFLYSVGEEELLAMEKAAGERPQLLWKLRDVRTVYQGFQEYIQEKYITAEGILEALSAVMEDSRLLENSVVCLDGFTGFTPSQYQVLRRLLKKAEDVYVTVTIDEREDITRMEEEFRLFHLSKKTIHHLFSLARETGCEILPPVYPKKAGGNLYRFYEEPALGFLEKNLFRSHAGVFQERQESIRIRGLKNPRAEVLYTIQKIRYLLREKGFRYRDIAVVTGDLDGYGKLIEEEYSRCGIPYFMDNKREILKNPYCRLLSGLLELFSRGFDYESMFRCLRSGMLPMEEDRLDKLENYVLALGIRGYEQWNNPFHRIRKGIEPEELLELNETREEIMGLLRPLWERVSKRGRTVRDYTEGLYEFSLSIQAYEKLAAWQKAFEAEGNLLAAKEYGQVYRQVCEIFEQAIELLGEEKVSLKEYRELLETGLSKAKVGLIPAGVDQIVVGDMERTRLKDIKALFFLGVNDGMVPKAAKNGGILSDMERELLKESHIELAPTRRESLYTEQFYLYLNLTKAEKYLYLCYSFSGSEGKERKPSYLIGKISRMFPDAGETAEDWLEEHLGADGGFSYLLEGIQPEEKRKEEEEQFWQGLLSWYLKDPVWKEKLLSYIEAAFAPSAESKISRAAAKALYGEGEKGSVTRLEQYAACAFAHFVSYGLRLRERQMFLLAAPDLGIIFHEALERFAGQLKERELSWTEVDEELREKLTEQCVEEAAREQGSQIFESSSRNAYMLNRVNRILKRTLKVLTEQLGAGSFVPRGYEVTFSGEFTGRIDRLDLYEEEKDVYVKIIDYKSGHKTFDIVDLSYGLQLQLVVYLGAALEQVGRNYPDRRIVPAGIFYYNLEDPVVDKASSDKVEEAILKELKMSGLVNGERKILPLFDKDFEFEGEEGLSPSVKSKVVPVDTLKDGSFSKASSVTDTEGFQKLLHYTEKKIRGLSEEILRGVTKINPYKLGERCACDYCSFHGICGFDRKREEFQYRKLKERSKEEVWREIYGEDEIYRGSAEGH